MSVEERLARIEAKVEELSKRFDNLESHILSLYAKNQKRMWYITIALLAIVAAMFGVKIPIV